MAAGGGRPESVNSELLTLTYGAMVSQLIRDYESPLEVNVQLEAMGYNIGVRVVDEFCAKSRGVRCRNFRETMDTVAREAFKMFLGVSAVLTEVAADGSSCVLRIPDNPLAGACARGPGRLLLLLLLLLLLFGSPRCCSPLNATLRSLAPPPRPPQLAQTLWSCRQPSAPCATATSCAA
jgi:hypothetical protein